MRLGPEIMKIQIEESLIPAIYFDEAGFAERDAG